GSTGSTQDPTLHSICLMKSLFLDTSSLVPKATETTDKPAKAKRIKHSISRKTRQPKSSPKSVGALEAKEVPAEEHWVIDEEADYQKAMEESMKDAYALPKGPLPLVVIREPELGKYQPLPKVPGKGKAKVTEEQVVHDLLSLQKHKKTSPADQYIFQRRTGSDAGAQAEGQAGSNTDETSECQAGLNPDETSEGQARSNPDETSKGQDGPDPGDAEAKVQSISSHVVHAGSDREYMDLDVANVSPQPSTEQLDEGPESPKEHQQLKATIIDTTTTTIMLPPPQAPQQSTAEAMMVKRIENEKESRVTKNATWVTISSATSSSSPAGPSGASGAPRASGSAQMPPSPPPPSSTNQESSSKGSATLSPSKTAASGDYQAWTMTDIKLRSASVLASNYSPPPEDSLLAQTGDIATFMDWFCKRRGIAELKPQDLEGPANEIVKVFHLDVIHLQYQMGECHKLLTDSVDDPILRHNVSKPLPLGGPLGQVTIQFDFFFNKDLEYLRYGSKGRKPALSISKVKAAYYPDAGLEQMVPDQFWIEEECKCDIAAMYGISHWWFQRQRFYIDRHTSEGDRSAVRTHMRILSVIRIEVFSMYGYDYMKKIVIRHADLNEHVIAERDFKYLYPSDFEDLYL
nr:hypothetical protein [Tanacetum cinerariifolium]